MNVCNFKNSRQYITFFSSNQQGFQVFLNRCTALIALAVLTVPLICLTYLGQPFGLQAIMLLKNETYFLKYIFWLHGTLEICMPNFSIIQIKKKNFTSEVIPSNVNIKTSTSLLGKMYMLNLLTKSRKTLKDQQNSEYYHKLNYWNKS